MFSQVQLSVMNCFHIFRLYVSSFCPLFQSVVNLTLGQNQIKRVSIYPHYNNKINLIKVSQVVGSIPCEHVKVSLSTILSISCS